jgi:hypothetical protein
METTRINFETSLHIEGRLLLRIRFCFMQMSDLFLKVQTAIRISSKVESTYSNRGSLQERVQQSCQNRSQELLV